jgi:outer membrane protein OmpA-like peptidoglycan-associated protein
MVSLQKIPDEIAGFIARHNLMRADIVAIEQPAQVQQAIARVAGLALRSFAELAGQATTRDALWNTVREAAAAGPAAATTAAAGSQLLKRVLDDRYHGTVSATAAEAGVSIATIGYLLELVPAAALATVGAVVTEQDWTAQQLAEWLRPRQHIPVAPPVSASMPRPAPAAVPHPRPEALPNSVLNTAWLAQPAHALLVVMSVIAAAEFGYILKMRPSGTAATEAVASAPGTAATPVANQAVRPPVVIPAVLRLKSGGHRVSEASSTESKLYRLLIDPAQKVNPADPTKGWISLDRVYFEPHTATLTEGSGWPLANVTRLLAHFPKATIKLSYYTDSQANLLLSKQRAEAATRALVRLGVPPERLEAAEYGVLGSKAATAAGAGRALSLRVTQK